jgi:hypothetical protein
MECGGRLLLTRGEQVFVAGERPNAGALRPPQRPCCTHASEYLVAGKDYKPTDEEFAAATMRRPNPNYSYDDRVAMKACYDVAYDDDTPENRTIKAHTKKQEEQDRKQIQRTLSSDPYAFCGMVEGAACRH